MDHSEQVFTSARPPTSWAATSNAVAGTIKFLGIETAKHPVNALAKALTEVDIDDLRRVRATYQQLRAGRDTRAAEAGPVAAATPPRRKRRCRRTRSSN